MKDGEIIWCDVCGWGDTEIIKLKIPGRRKKLEVCRRHNTVEKTAKALKKSKGVLYFDKDGPHDQLVKDLEKRNGSFTGKE